MGRIPTGNHENTKARQVSVEAQQRAVRLLIGAVALLAVADGIGLAEHVSTTRPQARIVHLAGNVGCQAFCQTGTVLGRLPVEQTAPKAVSSPTTTSPLPEQPPSSEPTVPPVRLSTTVPLSLPAPSPVSLPDVSTTEPPAILHSMALSTPQAVTSNPNDISYPQCTQGLPPQAPVGIVGVNQGHPFSSNQCLINEVALYPSYQLYVNADYPGHANVLQYQRAPRACGPQDEVCQAYNYGYNSGVYAFNYATSQVDNNPVSWWLDVETGNKWDGSPAVHRSALQGELDALTGATPGKPIGFYSTVHMWQVITGGWQNNMPAWVATGSKTAEDAVPYCLHNNFTGGKVVMAQYVQQFDQDVICP